MNQTDIGKDLEFFLDTVCEEIPELSKRLDLEYYQGAIDLILNAEKEKSRLHVTGIGKPHHVSAYVASLLSSTGTPCYLLDGTEATHGSSGQVLPGDVVMCISYYGDVPELMATVTALKKNGARIISVTGFEDSWIARQADVHLLVHVQREGDRLNKPPRTSILAILYVLMGLSVLLQTSKGLTAEQYVRWHPGGRLGKTGPSA